MEIKIICPTCGQKFTVDVDATEAAPKERKSRTVSDKVRKAASERMKAMRAAGIGGRPKGVKEKGHRSTFGVARKARGDG